MFSLAIDRYLVTYIVYRNNDDNITLKNNLSIFKIVFFHKQYL